jgi:hypothetical protein
MPGKRGRPPSRGRPPKKPKYDETDSEEEEMEEPSMTDDELSTETPVTKRGRQTAPKRLRSRTRDRELAEETVSEEADNPSTGAK